ncbi:MAG: hypothetical protein D6726_07520, partial [Nitrospirae bacterium]
MEDRGFLKKRILTYCLLVVFIFGMASCTKDQCVFFHDKEIRGYVLEAQTGEPIEGAVVVAAWALTQVPGEGFGGYARIIETVTDKDGKFVIPSWWSFKPWKLCSVMYGNGAKIIIYKPGYE